MESKSILTSRKMLFLLPVVLLLVTRLGIEISVRIFDLRFSWIPAFMVYYAVIEWSFFYAKRKLAIEPVSISFSLRPAPKWNRLVFGVIVPALLPFGFFLLNVNAVPITFLVFIIVFALVNPYFEERFWRGLLSFLPAGNKVKIFYSALLFCGSHYFLWGAYWLANPPEKWIAAVITTFIMGILWMWFYQKDGRLEYPILSHILVDIFNLSFAVFYGIALNTI